MINIILPEYLGTPNIPFVLLTYTKHSAETYDMVLQSSHCYSSSLMKANIISFPDLITKFKY